MPIQFDKVNFLGLPTWSLPSQSYHAQANPEPNGVLLGIESTLGAPYDGCENGPYFIRRLSQQYVWQDELPELIDLRRPQLHLARYMDAGNLALCNSIEKITEEIDGFFAQLPSSTIPFMIGGDHSITYPIIQSLMKYREHDPIVVCFDHHLDLQLWGDDLDALYHTNVMSHVSNLVGTGRIIHIGVDPLQTVNSNRVNEFIDYLSSVGKQIPLFSGEINNDSYILDSVGRNKDIYISIDVDVLNKSEMSSTGYPSDYGLSMTRLLSIVTMLIKQNNLIGCDVVEFRADRNDRRSQTLSDAGRAARILIEMMLLAS